jgi:4-amino-4-deoxy-L-arabinose transferase-like glycosyltransferase
MSIGNVDCQTVSGCRNLLQSIGSPQAEHGEPVPSMADTIHETIKIKSEGADARGNLRVFGIIVGKLGELSGAKAVVIAFTLALTVSIFFTWVVRPMLGIERPLGGEGYDGYLELAQNLARGNGYVFEPGGHKVFHRPPLYPMLLVPGTLMPGVTWRLYVAVLNSALFALGSLSVLLLGRAMLGNRTGGVAWLLFTLNPLMLVACKNAIPAMLQTAAYATILYLSYILYLKYRSGEVPSFGFVLGFAAVLWAGAMSHGTTLVHAFLILGVLGFWAVWRRRWREVKSTFLAGLLLVLGIAPWTWRNYQVTGLFLPVVGNSGLAYFAGNAHWGITKPAVGPEENRNAAELRHMGFDPARVKELIRYYGFTDPEHERIANDRAREHMREHPVDFLKKVGLNAAEYYAPVVYYIFPPKGAAGYEMNLIQKLKQPGVLGCLGLSLFSSVLAMLGFAGFCVIWKREPLAAVLLLAAWAAFAVPYFPFLTFFAGRSTYTFGTFPVLSILIAGLIAFKANRAAGSY